MEERLKAGMKTSEFWLAIGTLGSIFSGLPANDVQAVAAAVISVGYAIARAIAKRRK